MKLYRILLIFLLAAFAMPAYSQQFKVTCELQDSITGESEPFATVRVDFFPPTKQAVTLRLTDDDGRFEAILPEAGDYVLTASATGKRPVSRQFSVNGEQPEARLGIIRLSGSVELQEVEVLAQKPLVTSEIDRIAYSVADDSESATKSTLDLLRKVPMVTVDGEDNIKVKGSSNFKVLVNGKPNPMMSGNPKEVFRSLPASAVKSIEVITEPGARYDAEGVGGILNIVLQDVKVQGYNLSLSANGDNNGSGGSVYGTYQLNKFTVTGLYNYYGYWPNDEQTETERVEFDEDGRDLSRLYSLLQGDNSGNVHYGSLQASYELDSLNLFTLAGTLMAFDNHGNHLGTTSWTGQGQHYGYDVAQNSRMNSLDGSLAFDYQRSFRREGEFLTASYRFSSTASDHDGEQTYGNMDNVPFDLPLRRQSDDRDQTEHTAQIDYVNPFSGKHYFDTGAKYIARRLSSDSRVWLDGTFDLPSSVLYAQKQDVFALYADYKLQLGKLNAMAGVRYEHTRTEADYKRNPESNFSAHFNDIVPSVTASYSLGMTSMLRLAYYMRINRPGIQFLSPFRSTTDPAYVQYGNPNLDTEHWHNVSLNFSSFSQRLSYNLSLNYGFTDNGITEYSFLQDGVQHTTYGNLLRSSRVGLTAWGSWSPGKRTRLMLNLNTDYADMRSNRIEARNSGFDFSAYGSVDQEIGWKMKLILYGGGGLPFVALQGEGMSYYFYGFSLSRSFLKDDRLTVSAFANNLYPTNQRYETTIVTDSFRNRTTMEQSVWRAGLSLSFRLGDLNTQVKRTARTITNDDLKKADDDSVPQQGMPEGMN